MVEYNCSICGRTINIHVMIQREPTPEGIICKECWVTHYPDEVKDYIKKNEGTSLSLALKVLLEPKATCTTVEIPQSTPPESEMKKEFAKIMWKYGGGCKNCYAETIANRFWKDRKFTDIICHEERLKQPLHWKKPSMIFVNSMSDLFHEKVPFEFIDKVFTVMSLCPLHTFQVLTKRPERMLEYCSDKLTSFRIAKQIDILSVEEELKKRKEKILPIKNYPGYYISNFGFVYSENGSNVCLYCGKNIEGAANKLYCDKKCGQNSFYHRKKSPHPKEDKFSQSLAKMSPDVGEQGHLRIMLYKNGEQFRELVHRLVLRTFDREPIPEHNFIWNLKWGTQSDNWEDSKRHGTFNRHHSDNNNIKPTIKFPLINCYLGVSVEDQKTADERIPLLLQTPAAVRWISAEPLLSGIDLTIIKKGVWSYDVLRGELTSYYTGDKWEDYKKEKLDWVVVGGESGPKKRPFNPDWARKIRNDCKVVGVPFFMKQIDKIQEIPKDLRIREFPQLKKLIGGND